MSWGERSCSQMRAPKNEHGGCAVAEMRTCNVYCKYYTWDGETTPDSGPNKKQIERIQIQEHPEREHARYSELSKSQKRKLRRKSK